MSEAEKLYRIISASVRDILDAYRIQESAGKLGHRHETQIEPRLPAA